MPLFQAVDVLIQAQVNIFLVCYGLSSIEKALAEKLKTKLQSSNIEAIVCFDPNPEKVDKMISDLANYKLHNNKSLIMETFT